MILIVGGAGYIGSHTNKELNKKGYKTVVFDNLSSGKIELVKWGEFVNGDLNNIDQIREVFKKYTIDAVFHFAGSKSVSESITNPQKYYQNNVVNTLNLLQVMLENKVNKFIFSSSAATFGIPQHIPINESHPQNPINPYGETKLMIEHIMRDYTSAYDFNYVSLRYFNACGADIDSEIGEWPGSSSNLMPIVLDTAIGKNEYIKIFGNNYSTPDGTCIRDYIHVYDLTTAHILALDYLQNNGKSQCINLGSGKGFSVKEIIDSVKKITGKNFKVVEDKKREGDPSESIADSNKAKTLLKWQAQFTDLDEIIETAWVWHKKISNK